MEFLILGPLEVRADGEAVALPGAKPRAVLAVLLLQANQPVSAERLALALWGEDAPAGAANTVQVHVSRLRKALPRADALLTTAAGYELRVDGDQLDAHRFERLAAQGREQLAAGRAAEAAAGWRRRSTCGAGARWPTSRSRRSPSARSPASTSCAPPRRRTSSRRGSRSGATRTCSATSSG